MRLCRIIDVQRRIEYDPKPYMVVTIELKFPDGSIEKTNRQDLYDMIEHNEVLITNMDYEKFSKKFFNRIPEDFVSESNEEAVRELSKFKMLGVCPVVTSKGYIEKIDTHDAIINNACYKTYNNELSAEGEITIKSDWLEFRGFSKVITIKAGIINIINSAFVDNMLLSSYITSTNRYSYAENRESYRLDFKCTFLNLGYKFENEGNFSSLRKLAYRLLYDNLAIGVYVCKLGDGVIKVSPEKLIEHIKSVISVNEKTMVKKAKHPKEYYNNNDIRDLFADINMLLIIYRALNEDKGYNWEYAKQGILEIIRMIDNKFYDVFEAMYNHSSHYPSDDIIVSHTTLYTGNMTSFMKIANLTFKGEIFKSVGY